MKDYRRNRLLREFRDIDRSKAKKLLTDFIDARKALSPDKEYKENLYSRLEALRYKKESTLETIKKYFSSALAFTFVVSVVWLFYTQTDFIGTPVSDDTIVGVDPASLSDDIAEIMPMSDMGTRSMMLDSDSTTTWSDEDKELFQEICVNNGGFFLDDEYICILDSSDMCGLESLRNYKDNACNIFFSGEIDLSNNYNEILPFEGQ